MGCSKSRPINASPWKAVCNGWQVWSRCRIFRCSRWGGLQPAAGVAVQGGGPVGIYTGTTRSVAGSGSVVTAAGLVFAFTMASFIFSDLIVLGQIGTTIALGLLFDTLIVRSFMTPSIAALLGRWFWWPVRVRQRPVPQKFGDEDTRQLSLF
jgi:hypothetical protein